MFKKISFRISYKFFVLITISALIFSACKSDVGGPGQTPVTHQVESTPLASGPIHDSGLEVIDDGSPLPPIVIEQQPQGGTEFPVEGQILLTFDQPMKPTETSNAWEVSSVNGIRVNGKIDWPESSTLRFTPAEPLARGTIYNANLTTDAVSESGIKIQEPYRFQFATVGELAVSQVFPADRAKEVSSSTVITVIFNRPVVQLVVAEDQSILPQPLLIDPYTAGKGEWVNTSVYTYHPEKPLQSGIQYTATINAGLKDASSETQLEEPFIWSFVTAEPSIDTLELSTGQVNPEDNFQGFLPDAYFTLRFLQPMDQESVESALSLTSETESLSQFIQKWNENSTTLIFTPTEQLAFGSDYALELGKEAQAIGGGELKAGLSWKFKTIPLPGILSTIPSNNSIQDEFGGDLLIKFASPMRIETVKERIVITPKPDEDVEWWYNEWDWSMSGFFLEPSLRYTIQFLPGMEDIYGNVIQSEKTIRFRTADRRPSASLALPYELPVFRGFGPIEAQQFYATYTNVNSTNFKLAALTPDQVVGFLTGSLNAYQYQPPPETVIWEHKELSKGALNERVLGKYQLTSDEGSLLPPGFYFLGMDSPEVRHSDTPFVDYRLLVVAGANLTFKSTATEALLWLTDLETGEPIENAKVTVYDQTSKAINTGTTSIDGSLRLELTAPADPYEARFAISENGRAFGFASSQWGSGISLYDYGIWSSFYSLPDQPTVYIYTERPLYRPGQPVYFKGIVRQDDDLDFSIPDLDAASIRISSYKDVVYDEELELTSFGSFSGKFQLDPEAVLGYYTLEVMVPKQDQVIGSITFNVAEYRKPEFQTTVSTIPINVLKGDHFTATVQANYYSGGSVSEAEVNWSLISEPFNFSPPSEFSSYSFQDIEDDSGVSEEDIETSQVIAEGQGITDSGGSFQLDLLADLSSFKTSRSFTFEANVTDLAGTLVSGRDSVTVHKSAVYPGIKPQIYIGEQDKPLPFEIVALDWGGSPLAGQSLSIDIVERRWYSVQEQDPSGRVTWKSSVENIPIESFTKILTDENGEASVSFVPPKGGIYQARVTALDENRNPGVASATVWVAGTDYIPWQQTNDRSFDLVADKKQYDPGETAQLLIASPFEGEPYALVTVERGSIRFEEVIKLNSNSTVYELPITPDLAPNVFISVLIVKGVDAENPRPNFKMGISEIQVNPSKQSLQVELIPDRTSAGPGEQVSYTVRTKDSSNHPIQAEVSLSLSDLATLSLLPPNSQPILDFFYSERSLGVWTSVPMSLNIDDYNAEIEDNLPAGDFQGSGGGKGEGELGVVSVRQDFPDTAFWDAHVVTGDNGEATVVVNLPDNLTTWRMDARAVTMNTEVGQTELDIVSSKPLLVRPQTPRFFVVGDHVQIGTAVHNNTDSSLSISVSVKGQGLEFQSPSSQVIEIAAQDQAYVSWDAEVLPQARRVDLIFSARGKDYEDSSRPPLGTLDQQGIPVYRYEAPETIGTSGQLSKEETRIETILLPSDLEPTSGELIIRSSPSLAAGMTDGLKYLQTFPYECVEMTVSSFLPNVISTRALNTAGIQDPVLEKELEEQVNTSLQRIYKWQNPDGGWGWWSSEKSDPLTSAYSVLGLIESREAGYTADEAVFMRGRNYLQTQILKISGLKDPQLINRQAFLLYVLARSGKPDVSSTVQLYDQRQRMALYARAFLGDALSRIDPNDPRLDALVSDLTSAAILSSTGSHWEEKEPDRLNWNSDTRTTAIILSTITLLDPENPLAVNAVRWLMSNRTQGHWIGTQETSWTLMALTNWMTASGELNPDFEYAVALNNERLGGGTATSENLRETLTLKADISELLKDEANRLAFAHNGGAGNLYYTAHLDLTLPVEEIQPLDRGVIVSRSYYRTDDLSSPVTEANLGDLLLARVTVVAPYALHNLVVDDPLPAGMEAVDQSLNTSPHNLEVPEEYSSNDIFWKGWGWWYFSRIQRKDEKVVLSATSLPAGTYIYTYLIRAGTVGEFHVIPPTAREFYFPEVYGRGQGSSFTVDP